jgi:hypothetical protein
MTEQAKDGWPKTSDGTTDWEAVFEAPEGGLIPLIAQANSPQTLRECAIVTIQMLYSRDNDAENVTNLTSELNELVPDDAKPHQLDFFSNAITSVLRQIKQERIDLAEEYVKNKKLDEEKPADVPETVAPEPSNAPPEPSNIERRSPRKTNKPSIKKAKKKLGLSPIWSIAAAAVLAIILGGGVYFIFGPSDTEVAAKAWAGWAKKTVTARLPSDTWAITSAKQGDGKTVVIEILISDKNHIAQIKSTRRIVRAEFLKSVCPTPESGISRMIEVGWNLWITLKSNSGNLTGGTCKY